MTVQFEENSLSAKYSEAGEGPYIVRYLIKKGLAKDKSQAAFIIASVSVFVIMIAGFFAFKNTKPEELDTMQNYRPAQANYPDLS